MRVLISLFACFAVGCVAQSALPSSGSYAPIYDRAVNGVIALYILRGDGDLVETANGTGFIIADDRAITNYHVVQGSAAITAIFADRTRTRARVIATDARADLALLALDGRSATAHALPLAKEDQVKIGDVVFAIANPFGYHHSMSLGIISAKGRFLGEPVEESWFVNPGIIQSDVAINPGSSGAPLINAKGEVIGIAAAIRTEFQTSYGRPLNTGLSFFIPASAIQFFYDSVMEKGKVEYPYLGVVKSFNLYEVDLNHEVDLDYGVVVTEVDPQSSIGQSDFEVSALNETGTGLVHLGDVIVGVDGQVVYDKGQMYQVLLRRRPGDEVSLEVWRGGQLRSLRLTLGAK